MKKYTLFIIIILNFAANGKKKIVMSEYIPMIICDQEQKKYSGIDLDVLNELITCIYKINIKLRYKVMNWSIDDFEFICYENYKEMITDALNTQNNIFMAIGGISISSYFFEKGAKFTQPYFSNKLNVISKVRNKNIISSIIDLFSLDFILTFIFTMIALGFIIYWLERKKTPIQEIFVHMYNHLLNFDNVRILNYEVKLIDITHYIFSYILIIVFIANLINSLMTSTQNSQLNSLQSLKDKKIVTFAEYSKYLDIYKSFSVLDEGIGNQYDVDRWLNQEGIYGVAIDSTLNNLASFIFCDNYISINEIAVVFFGFMMNSNFDENLLRQINNKLLEINAKFKYQDRYLNFVEREYADFKCNDRVQLITDGTVGLIAIKEIWYLLLIGLGISVVNFAYLIYKRFKINKNYGAMEMSKSRILQSFESNNYKDQKTLKSGKKRLSVFQEYKKKTTVYLNHDPRALMDSNITYNLCQLFIQHLKIFKNINFSEREAHKTLLSKLTFKKSKTIILDEKKDIESIDSLTGFKSENNFKKLNRKVTFFSNEELHPHFFDIIKNLKKKLSTNENLIELNIIWEQCGQFWSPSPLEK